jgi:hypothetical protein
MPRNNGDLSQGQEDGSEKRNRKPHPPISFPLPSTVKATNRIPDVKYEKDDNYVAGSRDPVRDTADYDERTLAEYDNNQIRRF